MTVPSTPDVIDLTHEPAAEPPLPPPPAPQTPLAGSSTDKPDFDPDDEKWIEEMTEQAMIVVEKADMGAERIMQDFEEFAEMYKPPPVPAAAAHKVKKLKTRRQRSCLKTPDR